MVSARILFPDSRIISVERNSSIVTARSPHPVSEIAKIRHPSKRID